MGIGAVTWAVSGRRNLMRHKMERQLFNIVEGRLSVTNWLVQRGFWLWFLHSPCHSSSQHRNGPLSMYPAALITGIVGGPTTGSVSLCPLLELIALQSHAEAANELTPQPMHIRPWRMCASSRCPVPPPT